MYKNTAPCFLSEGKWDGAAKGALLWPGVSPWRGTRVLAAQSKKKKSLGVQTIDVAACENVCLSPSVEIKLCSQVAGRFRAASCRRRTCSSWFLPVARAATTATARCSTATCAPWAAAQTRAASADRPSVSEAPPTVAFGSADADAKGKGSEQGEGRVSNRCVCNSTLSAVLNNPAVERAPALG